MTLRTCTLYSSENPTGAAERHGFNPCKLVSRGFIFHKYISVELKSLDIILFIQLLSFIPREGICGMESWLWDKTISFNCFAPGFSLGPQPCGNICVDIE